MRRVLYVVLLSLALVTFLGAYSCSTTAPQAPNSATTTAAGGHQAKLTWPASPSSGIYYRVYRSQISGGPYTRIADNISKTNYVDKTVQSGQTYYFVVTAVFKTTGVESSYSPEGFGTIP